MLEPAHKGKGSDLRHASATRLGPRFRRAKPPCSMGGLRGGQPGPHFVNQSVTTTIEPDP
jgi:hypothetical protein